MISLSIIFIIVFVFFISGGLKTKFGAALSANVVYPGFSPVGMSGKLVGSQSFGTGTAISTASLSSMIKTKTEYNQWALFLATQANTTGAADSSTPLSLIANIGESTLARITKQTTDFTLISDKTTFNELRSTVVGVVTTQPFFVSTTTNVNVTGGNTAFVGVGMNLNGPPTTGLPGGISGVTAQLGIFKQNEWGYSRALTTSAGGATAFTAYCSIGTIPSSGYIATAYFTNSNSTSTDCFAGISTTSKLGYLGGIARNMDMGVVVAANVKVYPETNPANSSSGATLTYCGIRTTQGCTGWSYATQAGSSVVLTNSLLPPALYPFTPYGELASTYTGGPITGTYPTPSGVATTYNYVLPTKLYSPNKMYSLRICHSLGKVCLFDYGNNFYYTGGGLNEVSVAGALSTTTTPLYLPIGCTVTTNAPITVPNKTINIYQSGETIYTSSSSLYSGWLYEPSKQMSINRGIVGNSGGSLYDSSSSAQGGIVIPNKSGCTISSTDNLNNVNFKPSQLVLVGTAHSSGLTPGCLYSIKYGAMNAGSSTNISSSSYQLTKTPTNATTTTGLSSFTVGEGLQITLRDDGALYITGGPIANPNTKLYYRSLNTNYFIERHMIAVGCSQPNLNFDGDVNDTVYDVMINTGSGGNEYNYTSADTGYVLVKGSANTIPGSSQFTGTNLPPVTSDVYRGYVCWLMNAIFNNNPMVSDVLNYTNSGIGTSSTLSYTSGYSVMGFSAPPYAANHASPLTSNRAWADAAKYVTVGNDGSYIISGSTNDVYKAMYYIGLEDYSINNVSVTSLKSSYKLTAAGTNALPAASPTFFSNLMGNASFNNTKEKLAATIFMSTLSTHAVKYTSVNSMSWATPATGVKYRTFLVPATSNDWANFYEGAYATA